MPADPWCLKIINQVIIGESGANCKVSKMTVAQTVEAVTQDVILSTILLLTTIKSMTLEPFAARKVGVFEVIIENFE